MEEGETVDNVLMDGIGSMPIGWQIWVYWMMLINTASIVFIARIEARVVLAVWIANAITMTLMAEVWGFVRLLGLVHLLWWTPLVAYLIPRVRKMDASAFRVYLIVLLATICASLVIDAADVVRYGAGERQDLRPPGENHGPRY